MGETNKTDGERDPSDLSDKDTIQETAIARAASRRDRHQQRPLIVRVLVVAAGVLLTAPGLLLVWVIPGVGLLLLLTGLRMLSLEFEWAAKAQGWVEWRSHQIRNWFGRQSLTVKIGFPLLLVATAVFVLLSFVL